MRFPGFYGNEGLKARLSASLRAGGLSHCYILEGPEGSGKRTLGRLLAAAMECQGPGDVPCGGCPACRKIFGGGHPDVVTVDSDTATVPIRLIREMQADAYIRPNEGRRKVYLLPRAQDMQPPAQNALLKLLEEPPEYCAFLLMTRHADQLLSTVRSRAVTLSLSPLTGAELLRRLKEAVPEAEERALAAAIDRSDGFLGAALELLSTARQDPREAALLEAIESEDALMLLETLVPMEKLKRQEFLALLSQLYRTLVRAMGSGALREAGTPARRRNGARLASAAEAVSHAITLLQANGSSGHAAGYLLSALAARPRREPY